MRRATELHLSRAAGVTLVEMIVAIVVTGILVALTSMFGRNQIEAYFDVTNRAALSDAADTALRRITRDLQAALPNSVRVSGDYIEFVPVRDAGRYRAMQTPAATGDILDFSLAADASFDVLGPTVAVAAGEQLVVYNLGIAGADVYAGDVRRAIPAGGVGAARASVVFTPTANPFPLASPMNRFYIVGQPVTYRCDTGAGVVRRHWNYGFVAAQPTPPGAGSNAILVNGVTACAISYAPGVQQRNGIVSLRLTLTGNGESVTLMQQVDVLNSP